MSALARINPRQPVATIAWVVVAVGAGVAVAATTISQVAAVVFAVIAVWVSVVLAPQRDGKRGMIAVEVPIILLLLSTIVIRGRDASALAENPLDAAGLYRVACVGLAILLGGASLIGPRLRGLGEDRLTTRPFRLYALYVAIVWVSAFASRYPALSTYRAIELLAGLIVIGGALRAAGRVAIQRIERVLFGWFIFTIATVWLGALISPSRALLPVDSFIPVQLQGVFPSNASNTVGFYGVLLCMWCLGLVASRTPPPLFRPRSLVPLAVLGGVTLFASQYRTGYVAFVVALVALLVFKGKRLVLVMGVAVALLLLMGTDISLRGVLPFLLRGQSVTQAQELSGRLEFWQAAFPVWKSSPVVGAGLGSAARFEVLRPLGFSDTSTLHSTWVEALVGTGLLGVGALAAAFLLTLARSVAGAFRPERQLVPLLLMLVLVARSISGTSVEIFGFSCVLFFIIGLKVRDKPERRDQARVGTEGPLMGASVSANGRDWETRADR